MVVAITKSKVPKVLCLIGSIFLLVMAIFHGSGFNYVRSTINESNAEEFLKEIVPVLFAHPSIHLIGLAAFGMLCLFLKQEAAKILMLLSFIVLTDAFLAFYLGGILPGVLLMIPTFSFAIGSFYLKWDYIDEHAILHD